MKRTMKTFAEYGQALTEAHTKQYPMMGNNMIYPALKCAGEAGELADKIGKHWRNHTNKLMQEISKAVRNDLVCAVNGMSAQTMTDEFKVEVMKEMGDVLWYLWAMCEEMGTDLETIAILNAAKVTDRAKRGVVCSQGDNR